MEHDGVCKSLPLGSTPSQTNPIHALFLWDILCIILLCASMTPVACLYFHIIRPRFCMRFKRCPLYATLPSHLIARTHTHTHTHTQCTTIWDTLKAVMARSVLFWQESWNSIKVRCIFIQDLFPDHILRGLAELRLRAILEPGHILCSRPRPWSGIRLNLSNPDICQRRAISTESSRLY